MNDEVNQLKAQYAQLATQEVQLLEQLENIRNARKQIAATLNGVDIGLRVAAQQKQ